MKTQYGWSPNGLFLSNPQARKQHNYGDSWHRDLNIKDGMTPDVAVPICGSCCKGSCCWRCGRDVRSRGQRVQSLFAKKVDDSMKKDYCHLSLSMCTLCICCVCIYIYAIYDIHIHNIWYMIYIYIYYTISIFTMHVQTKCHRIDISTEMTWPQWPELQPLEIFTVAAGVSPGSLLGGSS